MVLHQTPANRRFILTFAFRNAYHVDAVLIINCASAPIEHPVGVSRQREPIARVVSPLPERLCATHGAAGVQLHLSGDAPRLRNDFSFPYTPENCCIPKTAVRHSLRALWFAAPCQRRKLGSEVFLM